MLVLSCKAQEKEPQLPPEGVEEIIMNFELTETVKGLPTFNLRAQKALSYPEHTVVYKVSLLFYKEGAPYATLTSDSGIVITATNDMEAMGNVKVVGVEEATLETESLKWLNELDKITTDQKVLITTKEGKKIEGRHFESDPGLTNIKLKETYGYSN